MVFKVIRRVLGSFVGNKATWLIMSNILFGSINIVLSSTSCLATKWMPKSPPESVPTWRPVEFPNNPRDELLTVEIHGIQPKAVVCEACSWGQFLYYHLQRAQLFAMFIFPPDCLPFDIFLRRSYWALFVWQFKNCPLKLYYMTVSRAVRRCEGTSPGMSECEN